MSCVIVDREFYDTGWNKVCFTSNNCGRLKSLSYRAVSTGDSIDRLVAVARNGCEILRFITPFGGSISYSIDLNEPIASIAGDGEVCVVFTTFAVGGGGWRLNVAGTPEGVAKYSCKSMWFIEWITSDKRALSATVNSYVTHFVLNMTGHRGEEGGGINRTFTLKVDGKEVWRQTFPNSRWYPGMPYVPPIVVEYNGYAGNVTLECNNCGDIWVVSGWATTPGGAVPLPAPRVNPIFASLATVSGALLGRIVKKRLS